MYCWHLLSFIFLFIIQPNQYQDEIEQANKPSPKICKSMLCLIMICICWLCDLWVSARRGAAQHYWELYTLPSLVTRLHIYSYSIFILAAVRSSSSSTQHRSRSTIQQNHAHWPPLSLSIKVRRNFNSAQFILYHCKLLSLQTQTTSKQKCQEQDVVKEAKPRPVESKSLVQFVLDYNSLLGGFIVCFAKACCFTLNLNPKFVLSLYI